jgi:NAD(P)-dependent dehydrogenase (short-subunit alcohol dehydrogenase family)
MEPQVVLVTGALSGIGRGAALAFARQGARLVLSDMHDLCGDGAAAALVDELRREPARVEFVTADVRHEDDMRRLADHAVEQFGRLDVAVNGAALLPCPASIADETLEPYAAAFDTNVLGLLFSMKHEVRAMLSRRRGSIVNIAARPGPGGAPEADHAAIGLTRAVARDVGESGIRVNAIASGTPEEVAEAAVFLASDRASFVTGATVRVRGDEVAA